jgi:hypothetical protein
MLKNNMIKQNPSQKTNKNPHCTIALATVDQSRGICIVAPCYLTMLPSFVTSNKDRKNVLKSKNSIHSTMFETSGEFQ